MSAPIELTLTQPDDWHLHLRDGAAMASVIGHSARQFARAIVMPNLKPPVTTTALALAYRARLLAARPAGSGFTPLMTLYLTDDTRPAEIAAAKASGVVQACKLYPAGATTNSQDGVTDLRRLDPVFAALRDQGLPLLVHGEVTDPQVDIFDRERRFIDERLAPIVAAFPGLKVVFEHITTAEAATFVRDGPDTLAATITPHHLLYNRNAMLVGGIRPHLYCLPVLKRERHRLALVEAAVSGHPRFFLGTDSAPHPVEGKESACGCAGCLQRPRRPGTLCRGLRAGRCPGPLGGVCQPLRTGFLRTAAQHHPRDPAPRALGGARQLRLRADPLGPAGGWGGSELAAVGWGGRPLDMGTVE